MEIIKLNLIPNGVNPVCHASQYDNGRVIRGELFDGLTPYTLASGDVVALNVRKPDNHVVTATLTATAGNSYVDIVTTEQMTACFGENLCELKITNGNTEIGTINFYMIVERDVLANGDPSQSVIEDLDALVQEAVGDNYYTKTETDNKLALKADAANVYTKTEVYNKTETDNKLTLKANAADVYNKTQIDEALGEVGTELERKADIDGSYEDMTVGNAEQLISTVYVEDKVPYNFRTSGGSADIGNRENDQIVGGTVAFNQLVGFSNVGGKWRVNNSYEIELTDTTTATTYPTVPITWKTNHKYFCKLDNALIGENSPAVRFYYDTTYSQSKTINQGTTSAWILAENSFGTDPFLAVNIAEQGSKVRLNIIDLTQVFGAAIADYIYSLEQGTAGAGVAWFKKLFPKSYYAYNAGELISVKTSAHVTTGFNAYNNSTGKAKLLGGFEYQITGSYTSLAYTDINGDAETITPDSNGLFTPTNNGELTVTGGNATDTCVHLVWSGSRNGQYEPYVKNTYELDSDLELRGIPKLDANNKLYYDGDTYSSDGSVSRRYRTGVLDGTQNAISQYMNSAQTALIVRFSTSGIKATESGAVIPNIANNKGIAVLSANAQYITDLTSISVSYGDYAGVLVLVNGKTTVDGVKQYLSENPVNIIYELAEPTTEQAEPYQDPQVVDDFGTEEYIDTRAVQVPVGHNTKYPVNLRDKVQHLPDLASSDGVYHIQQTGAQMALVADTSNGRLTALEAKVPAPPTADGTYRLTATVSNGSITYAWVSV